MAKVFFERITIEELKPLITLGFKDDPELLSRYSLLENPTLQQSVDKNYDTILETIALPMYQGDVWIYKLAIEDRDSTNVPYKLPIGFTVFIINDGPPHELFSFGINIKHRSRKTVISWLEGVKEHLGKFFYVGLHKNNTRVINFFEKNGFTKKDNEIDKNSCLMISNFNKLIKNQLKSQTHGS